MPDETILDSLSLVDTPSSTGSFFGAVEDTLVIWGTPQVGWNLLIADAITIVDAALTQHGITIDEWLLLREDLLGRWTGTETINDYFNIEDLSEVIRSILLSIADSITITDVANLVLALKVIEYIFLNDAVPVTDMFTVLEGLSLHDESLRSWDNVIADAMELNDAGLLSFLQLIGNVSDGFNLADSDVGELRINLLTDISLTMTDVVNAKANLFSLILESLAFDISISLGGEVWQCWVISNTDFDPSIFSGFNFNSYCSFQNKAYGMKSDGLYSLEGTTDNGTPVHSGVILASTNFSTENRKKFRRASLGLSGASAAIRVQTDEGEDKIFRITDRRAYIDRDVVGKDFIFSISDFDSLDFVELVPVILAR